MKRKEAVYKGLQFNSVWFEDKSLTSPNYFQITEFPTRLTSGKNLFKFRGHPNNLQAGSYLDIEVLDYNGDPIYHEVINYIDEDKSRVIVIYIYAETSPGDCTITMLGEAKNVPVEWRGRPNIKWTRSVPVNPNISNVSEIIFETAPDLIITEQIGPHLDRIYSGSQFPTFNGTARYFSYNGQPAVELLSGNFTNDMSTGTITVTSPANPAPISQYTIPTTAYSSTVKKILSPTLALLDTEYTVYSSQSISSHTYQKFDESAFSLTYEATPQYVTTQNSESFALVQINNLEPASGDVNRVKLFMNNKGTVGTWELINDVELAETEIFVTSTSSLFPDQSIGTFVTQSTIDTYWEGHTYQGKTETTAPTLTWITSSLQNAMRIQNAVDISNKNTISVAQIKSAYKGIFLAGSEYKVTLDALGTKTGTEDAVLSVYISGSAFSYNTTDYFNQEFPIILGKRIGELRVNTNNQRFDDKIFSFETSNDGTGVLILVVESGNWQVADIRTTSDNDSGYSPNYTRIRTLVPTAHKSDNQISFKAEYYSITGEKSKQISYVYNKTWEGGNRYIDGNYSMITGSLYVADSLESGVAISGYKNTGYIRSLGYNGFNAGNPGFLLWSGSALSGSTTTYQGVGLELYADTNNYFRYRTNPSELIVKTQKFFLGATSPANFISGSNGNLEISSSAFHLSPNGNITASAFIAVSGSIKLFDSNNRFVDANNVGRVVYFDQTEKTFDVSTIASVATAQTASVFQTFILPGETEMQMAFTWRHINSDTISNSIQYRVYIQSASLTTNDGSAYGTFSTPRLMLSGIADQICSTNAASTSSGFYSDGITSVTDILTDHQGKYIQVYMIVYSPSSTPAGEFKIKNFVFRTSRILGNAVNDTQYQAIPESMSNS